MGWPELALPMLYTWIQSPSNSFRHASSQTWRGGPNGVRWIVALIARLVTTFSLIDHGDDVPAAIRAVVKPDDHKKNWKQLARISQMLLRSLKQSNERLASTFDAHASEWKSTVIKAHLTGQLPGGDTSGRVVQVTNGVPTDPEELQRIYERLMHTDSDLTLGKDSIQQYLPTHRRRGRGRKDSSSEGSAKLTDSNNSSDGKEIDIPLFSSEEDSSNPDDSVEKEAMELAEQSFRLGILQFQVPHYWLLILSTVPEERTTDPDRCANPDEILSTMAGLGASTEPALNPQEENVVSHVPLAFPQIGPAAASVEIESLPQPVSAADIGSSVQQNGKDVHIISRPHH